MWILLNKLLLFIHDLSQSLNLICTKYIRWKRYEQWEKTQESQRCQTKLVKLNYKFLIVMATKKINHWQSLITSYQQQLCNLPVYTHPFNGPLSATAQVSRYQKGKTNLEFTEARDSEWQWHQPGCVQVCTSLQTDNHASTPPLSFFTGRMPFLLPNQQCQSTEGTNQGRN